MTHEKWMRKATLQTNILLTLLVEASGAVSEQIAREMLDAAEVMKRKSDEIEEPKWGRWEDYKAMKLRSRND